MAHNTANFKLAGDVELQAIGKAGAKSLNSMVIEE